MLKNRFFSVIAAAALVSAAACGGNEAAEEPATTDATSTDVTVMPPANETVIVPTDPAMDPAATGTMPTTDTAGMAPPAPCRPRTRPPRPVRNFQAGPLSSRARRSSPGPFF